MKDLVCVKTVDLDAAQVRMLTRLSAWHGQMPEAYLASMTADWLRVCHRTKPPLERWKRPWFPKAGQRYTLEFTRGQFGLLAELAEWYDDDRWYGDEPGSFFDIFTAKWLRDEHAKLP